MAYFDSWVSSVPIDTRSVLSGRVKEEEEEEGKEEGGQCKQRSAKQGSRRCMCPHWTADWLRVLFKSRAY
jgi:hypothetical protein